MPTEQRTSTDFLALTISAGEGKDTYHWSAPRYSYRVQVQSDATDKRITFDYFDSTNRHDMGTDQLDRENLLYALRSFVSDAQAADGSFDEFCSDFGYSTDSREAKRTYDACRASLRKFQTLWHDLERFTPEYVLDMLAHEGIE